LTVFNANGAKLSSSIPGSIGTLSNIKLFNVGSNALTGAIPSNIWDGWTNVVEIDMSENAFSAETVIGSGVANWKSCKKMAMSNSGIGGNIPAEIGGMTSLEVLDLSLNSFSGDLPSEIGQLENIEELVLFSNGMNGTIPTELGNLANVDVFMLNDNVFTGRIPTQLGMLDRADLIQLDSNQLCESYILSWDWHHLYIFFLNLMRFARVINRQCSRSSSIELWVIVILERAQLAKELFDSAAFFFV
jgi:Leucine-rich repeat (LRR) protein